MTFTEVINQFSSFVVFHFAINAGRVISITNKLISHILCVVNRYAEHDALFPFANFLYSFMASPVIIGLSAAINNSFLLKSPARVWTDEVSMVEGTYNLYGHNAQMLISSSTDGPIMSESNISFRGSPDNRSGVAVTPILVAFG